MYPGGAGSVRQLFCFPCVFGLDRHLPNKRLLVYSCHAWAYMPCAFPRVNVQVTSLHFSFPARWRATNSDLKLASLDYP